MVSKEALFHRYESNPTEHTQKKYRRFCALYRAAIEYQQHQLITEEYNYGNFSTFYFVL